MPQWARIDPPPLPAALVEAITAAPRSGLGDGPQSPALAQWITGHPQLGFSQPPRDPQMADACRSALWLLAGDLERSHSLSQSIDRAEGSYWHGVMHRREGDFSNAKYWFRRAGSHPVLQQIGTAAADDLRSGSRCFDADGLNPLALVDACAQALRQQGEAAEACERIQWLEWQAWFGHCVSVAWPQETTPSVAELPVF